MELRDFIKTSLVDILGGIQDAQSEVNENASAKGAINPAFGELKDVMEKVEFDIAVTAGSESGGKMGGSINVYAAKFNAGIFGKTNDSKVSRLKFSVPIAPSTLKVTE